MNSFWVMSRISAGMTSGSLSRASTVIRGPSSELYAGVGTIHLLVSRCAYLALAEDPCAAGGQRGLDDAAGLRAAADDRGRERVRARHPGGDLARSEERRVGKEG